MATNIILCTPATPNNVTLYDPAAGCGGATAWTKSLTDTVVLSDNSTPVTTYIRSLSDTVTLSDGLAISASKILSDTATLSDFLFNSPGLNKGDSVTLSDAIANSFGLYKSDTVILSEAIAQAIGLNEADTVTLSENLSYILSGGGSALTLSLSDTVILSEAISFLLETPVPFNVNSRQREDRMSKQVREYIRDTVKSVSDKISFSYARESDFNAIRGKKFPAALLMPLNYTATITDFSRTLEYDCSVLFYDLDAKGDDEKTTQKILEKIEPLVTQFMVKLNLKSLTVSDDPEGDVTSEKIVISDQTMKARIKFTSDIVTGWEVTFKLSVPDPFNYCNIY